MSRRPRPAHRPTQLPTTRHGNVRQPKTQVAKRPRPKAIDFMSESEDAEPALSTSNVVRLQQARHDDSEESDDQDDSLDSGSGGEEDADAPRVAQWIDDEELELQASASDDGSPSGSDSDLHEPEHDDGEDVADDSVDDQNISKAGHSRRLRSLEEDLSTLPLGTLRNARRSLAKAKALDDSDSDSDTDSELDSDTQSWRGDDDASLLPSKDKDDKPKKPKSDLARRANKHAPTEVTSKRPVSRRRVVVDDQLPKPRDPRFAHSVGRYNASEFKRRYDFLSGLRKDELSTLREHLKRGRKLLINSPAHLRAEREEEVSRLERAMKRTESAVNTDNRERVELEAIRTAKHTEKEKRERGKTEWWMKRSEKKQLLAKARLDAIAAAGGKQAVKKAAEKKQKKISQKEKKMRPFPRSGSIETSSGKRRRPVEPDSREPKRRRIV